MGRTALKVGLLAVVVCAVVALGLGKILGGQDRAQTTTRVVELVHGKDAAPRTTGTKPASRAPPKPTPPGIRTPRPRLPLEGTTISVDPGHNGGNFSDPEAIDRPVPAGANGTTKPCNTTGTETDDGSLTEARFNWEVAQTWFRASN